MICGNPGEGDGVGGRKEIQEGGDMGTYICLWLMHVDVRQKQMQYCRAIILQLKINEFLKDA